MSSKGTCPEPFLPLGDYPASGGEIQARFCSQLTNTSGYCCLPCPKQDYVYPDNFKTLIHATSYLNLVGVGCCVFLLLSFVVLPVEYTHRHYLSVSLTFAILLMQASFVVPFGGHDNQCYDAITPNDMFSSMSCALSGAFVVGGGWCSVMWVFLRTLSLHLQICWQVVPGRKFFLSAQAAGWSIPVIFLAVALSVTGVSFRFGESCHINSKNSLQTFWGPLLAVAAASIVTQSITFGYCIQVYLRSLFEEKHEASIRTQLPYATSIRTVTAAQAFKRIRRVFALQWRGIFVVIIIIADLVFFATVFLQFDGSASTTPENLEHAQEWVRCILENDGDKNKCLDVAAKMVVSEATAMAVLFLLAFNGIWALILLGRPSIFAGWWNMIKGCLDRNNKGTDEFVSFSARQGLDPVTSYEMLDSKRTTTTSTAALSPSNSLVRAPDQHYSLKTAREYNPSTFSAQLRGRSDEETGVHSPSTRLRSDSSFSTAPFSPYRDYESANVSPSLANSSFSPYREFRAEGENSDNDPTPTYPPEAKIGIGIAS
ncbi:hypothetical protein RUND412_003334 [Rhizina undulata]